MFDDNETSNSTGHRQAKAENEIHKNINEKYKLKLSKYKANEISLKLRINK